MKRSLIKILSIDGHYLTEQTSQFVYKEIRTWFSDVFGKNITFEECQKAIYEYPFDLFTLHLNNPYQVWFMASNQGSELFNSELEGVDVCEFIMYKLIWGSILREDEYFLKLYESINKVKLSIAEFRRVEIEFERIAGFNLSIEETSKVEILKF